MSEKDEKRESESERIVALEAEVARLRGRLEREQAPTTEDDPAPAPRAGSFVTFSRTKMILVGIGIAILALAGFALIFSALSSGFDSLARKAAKSFVPDDPGVGSSSPAPHKPSPPLPRAPGL